MTEKELNELKNSIITNLNALRLENVIDNEKIKERAEKEKQIFQRIIEEDNKKSGE